MSLGSRHTESQETTQHPLYGALKYVRAATLVAALVQLGVVALSPAVARAGCIDVAGVTCTVPEPGTLALVSVGAGVAAGAAWWRRKGKK